MDRVDCVVVGAGVVGLAVARAIARKGIEVVVLEAEADIGTQTSSRNSEVIHAGIYYPPGSLKARYCVQGKALLYEYCRDKGIRHQRIGKIIVATSPDEIESLRAYHHTASQNGVGDLLWLEPEDVARMEPNVKCSAALLSPSTGIIDSHELMISLQADIEAAGGAVICRSPVTEIAVSSDGFLVHSESGKAYGLATETLVNAAGLRAADVARLMRGVDASLVPETYLAKGHYYTLRGKAPFSHLIYPVPGQAGLGIHLTLDLAGQCRFGPDVAWIDCIDYEFDRTRKPAFVDAIRKYYPGLDDAQLVEGYTGIRPKLCGPGEASADFLIQGVESHRVVGLVQLFGIESPGLTASMAIAEQVVSQLTRR